MSETKVAEAKTEAKNALVFVEYADENKIPHEKWSALVNSLYVGAHPKSVVMVWDYCKARGLDVLKKPVHIVPMKCKIAGTRDKYEWRDVIFPGINEMRITASRTGLMAGQDEVMFGPNASVPITNSEDVKDPIMVQVPEFAKVTVYRLDKTGTPRGYTHIEYYVEAVARDGEGRINSMWRKRPHGQLGKCAEAGALRKAFPEELGGEYVAEEMAGKVLDEAGSVIEGEFKHVEPEKGDELAPVEKEAVEKPVDKTAPVASPAPAAPTASPVPAPAPAPAAPTPAPVVDNKAFKIDLPPPAKRVLVGILKNFGKTEEDLLVGFGKDISLSNVNEAIAFVKGIKAE